MKSLKQSYLAIATVVALSTSFGTLSTAMADEGMSEGTIKKIDVSAGKITIKHGPLDNLSMPAMTMVFLVPDLTMLESFSMGDEIEFVAADEGGKLIVKEIQAAH